MSSKQLTNSALGTIIYPLTNGPVAQLGAHHIRIVGVVGSNPIRSTKTKPLFLGARVFSIFGKPNVKAGLAPVRNKSHIKSNERTAAFSASFV